MEDRISQDSLHCNEYFFYKNNESETTMVFTEYAFSDKMIKSINRAVLIPLQNCTFKKIRDEMLSAVCPTNISDFGNTVFDDLNEEGK